MIRRCVPVLVLLACACGPKLHPAVETGAPYDAQPGSNDSEARQWERAGSWYSDDPSKLDRQISDLFRDVDGGEPRPARGILTPHASLRASGPIAAEVYARVEIPDTVILLAPKHFGEGESFATWDEGPWLVPGHALDIRHDLVDRLLAELEDDGLVADRRAFTGERSHPPEMQLPFLSRRNPRVELVPLSFHDHADAEFPSMKLDRIERVGEAIADLVREREEAGEDVMIVATTDLVHFQPVPVSDAHDERMLEYIANGDVDGFHRFVNDAGATICGEIPTAVFLVALDELGVGDIERIARGNSAHRSGLLSVVGYPGVIAWK